jgi:hypothetical protein
MSELLVDRAGRRRSPATMPGFHAGRAPGNKGLCYPADPPKVEEIIAVMRTAGDCPHGRRLRGLIVIMWRAGLRIQEALALTQGDLDQRRGSLLVRRGKGGRRQGSAWTHGDGNSSSPGLTYVACSRSAPSLRHQRHHTRPPLVIGCGTGGPAAHGGRSRSAAPLRAAPAPTRPRRRDGSRGRTADRHPAPTRTQRPRHHIRLPTRHRQRRDHRHRARPTSADDPRQRLAAALIHRQRAAPPRAKRNSELRRSYGCIQAKAAVTRMQVGLELRRAHPSHGAAERDPQTFVECLPISADRV